MSKRLLCQQQQNKVGFFSTLIVIAIIGFVGVNVTIVATNVSTQNRIMEKKSNIGTKRSEATKIKKALVFVQDYKVNKKLSKKHGFFASLDKQEFISSLITKMNREDDLDLLDDINDKKHDMEYSGFLIRLNPLPNQKLEKVFTKFYRQMVVSNMQKIDASIESSSIRVDFNADYEYVVYRMIEMLNQIFPGYLIVKNLSVLPINDDSKKMLYDRKFKNKKIDYQSKVDDRLVCSIELEWIFLKGTKPIN